MTALDELTAAFGSQLLNEIPARHLGDWLMKAGPGDQPLALLRPRSTGEVAMALAICDRHRVPVVAQGGLTGLAGGATPVRGALLISLELMTAIEPPDVVAQTMIVEAGTPLQRVQEAADAAALMFPLDIGARGSCTIGGNIATNAGGNRVLRYGMARDLVMGLEAVLADGTIVSSMNRMMKNNAGYDLKQLFIGSEGTLGIVTRAVLKLYPKPVSVAVAMTAHSDMTGLQQFLALSRARLGGTLTAFEVMWPEFYDRASALAGREPLPKGAGMYALLELSAADGEAAERMAEMLQAGIEGGMIGDAVVAQSLAQAEQIWSVRDRAGEVALAFDPVGNFDVSVPTSRIGELAEDCRSRLVERWPGMITVRFGHIVDGNLHLMLGEFPAADLHAVEATVYEVVREFGGSISAEHGIGLQKREFLGHSRTPEEIALMRRLKAALDPNGILNPGKVLSA